jgi:hypothetical protein
MPAFTREPFVLIKRALRLPAILFICLTAVSPLRAEEPPPAGRLEVSRSAPANPDDPLERWFREQDRLLDDILLRLARIETLVAEIHRLVSSLPDNLRSPSAAPPPARAAEASLPTKPPAQPAPTAPSFIDEWLLPLVGGGIAFLFLLWLAMRRRTTGKDTVADAPAVPPAPTSTRPVAVTAPPVAKPIQAAPATPPAPTAAVAPPSSPAPAPPPPSMHGGENEQAIELAEIMLSMGLGHGAAQTLTEQIRSEPKQALRHWLKLLEVYRRNGQQEEFERAAEDLRKHFNVQPEDWLPRPETQRSIVDYPHIATRLTELWGKPGCLVYLQNLLDDNRGGARAGFPQSAAEDLLLLAALIKSGSVPG